MNSATPFIGLVLTCVLTLTACASAGQNRIYTIIPKRELIQSHELARITEFTKDCYNENLVRAIANNYCGNSDLRYYEVKLKDNNGRKVKEIQKLHMQPPNEAMEKCLDKVFKIEKGRYEFTKKFYKNGYKIDLAGAKPPGNIGTDSASVLDSNLIAESCQHELVRWPHELSSAYWARDYKYLASDIYDTRTTRRRKIERGDPVNVIVNRAWIKDTHELFSRSKAEVAVVLSVDDGSKQQPQEVLVAYTRDIKRQSNLPISDLLAYSTDNYRGQPIRIKLSVYEVDQLAGDGFPKLISAVASSAGMLTSLITPGVETAAQALGSFLVRNNRDDKILEFTFQVYPWQDGKSDSSPSNVGVPRIARTSYLVLNTEAGLGEHHTLRPRGRIHLNDALEPVLVKPGKTLNENPGNAYQPPDFYKEATPGRFPHINKSYMVVTINDTRLTNAGLIIRRANELNRRAMSFADSTGLTPDAVDEVSGLARGIIRSLRSGEALKLFEDTRDRSFRAWQKLLDEYTDIAKEGDTTPEALRMERALRDTAPMGAEDCLDQTLINCAIVWRKQFSNEDSLKKYSFRDEEDRYAEKDE